MVSQGDGGRPFFMYAGKPKHLFCRKVIWAGYHHLSTVADSV